jgi:hypothetical protein
MQLDAAARSANLKVVDIEEPDAAYADDSPAKLIEILPSRLVHELFEHGPACDEPVVIRRCDVAMKCRVIRFDDEVRTRIIRLFQDDVDVMIALPLHARDPSNDFIDMELFIANAMVPGGTAMRGYLVQGSDAGVNHTVRLNASGIVVTQALHV